jgi:PIN domain nuclease of toxin-antitoxin system
MIGDGRLSATSEPADEHRTSDEVVPAAKAVVIDASALLAYARREPGWDKVAARIRSGDRVMVSSVNWAEAAGKLREYSTSPDILRQALAAVAATIEPFTESDADSVGRLTPPLHPLGLSLGDRACVCLALRYRAPALTAERSWTRVQLPDLVIEPIR